MQLGMIGLGRMGGNMTKRLRERGHDVKTYDPQVESTATTLEELRDQLDAPRAFWMMVPAGKITEDTFQTLLDARGAGRHDRRRRQLELPRLAAPLRRGAQAKGIHFVDAGVSGGDLGPRDRLLPDGRRRRRGGRSRLEPIFRDLAPEDGYAHVGGVRRRALHEDGPQRDRVRPHAGVRRGLRGDGDVRVRPRPARDRRHLALRLGRPLVAARAAARRVRGGGRRAREDQGLRRGLGRGPLDDRTRRSPRTCRCR